MSEKFHDDLSELHWRARGAAKRCGVISNTGYHGFVCTRQTGHVGNHVAHVNGDRISAVLSFACAIWGDKKNPHSHLNGLVAGAADKVCGASSHFMCSRRQGHKGDHLAHNVQGVCLNGDGTPAWWPRPAGAFLTAEELRRLVKSEPFGKALTPRVSLALTDEEIMELSKPGGFEAVVGPKLDKQLGKARRIVSAVPDAPPRVNGPPTLPAVPLPDKEECKTMIAARDFLVDVSPTLTDASVADQREAVALTQAMFGFLDSKNYYTVVEWCETYHTRETYHALKGRAARFISMVGMSKQPPAVRARAATLLGLLRQPWTGDHDGRPELRSGRKEPLV